MSYSRNLIQDALTKAREGAPERSFEQSVDVTVNFKDLDMRQPSNRLDLRLSLPNGIGNQKVLVFAQGDLALRARRAGADSVVEPRELDDLAKDKKAAKRRLKDYDIFVAEAPLMPTVGRVAGPILGPKGKMPRPLPPQADPGPVLATMRNTVRIRSKDRRTFHVPVGSREMSPDDITVNIDTVLKRVSSKLERGMANISSVYLKTYLSFPRFWS